MVIGAGYVGRELSLEFLKRGDQVECVDIKPAALSALQDLVGEELGSEAAGRLDLRSDLNASSDAEYFVIAVPTPLGPDGLPSLTALDSVVESLSGWLPKGSTVVLESTVAPTTTRTSVAGKFAEKGYKIGTDVKVGFASERLDPAGNTIPLRDIPKVFSGITIDCTDSVRRLYSGVFKTLVEASSPEEAEMSKLIENTYRLVNIALVNELRSVSVAKGVNFDKALDLAATKPFGFQKFTPGLGAGGHCIPIDPVYLATWARDAGEVSILDAAIRVNGATPEVVANKLLDEVFQRGLTPSSSSLLIVGRSYKPNSDDLRESPYFPFMHSIKDKFASVTSFDPIAKALDPEADLTSWDQLEGKEFDVVVCLQQHDGVVANASKFKGSLLTTVSNGRLGDLGWAYLFEART
jgi:UDP-N-acetyl-D-glucosamine dehydrogenase